jgi:ABC-type amino acid transport substrate-binding protein
MRGKFLTRYTVVGGVVALLLAAVALGLLVRGREDDGTLERVRATGELRVGLDASFPPFESLDTVGNVVGFDADLADAIAKTLGTEAVFVNVGFDGLYDALLAGRVDVVISGLPYDPRRAQDVIYSEPYFNAGQMLVVRADDTAFTQGSADIPMPAESRPVPALSGRVVAVEWGSLADMEARRLKQTAESMATLPQPTAQEALTALVAGQADAAIADAVSVYQFMGENNGDVRIVETLTEEPYVIASRTKSRRLAQAIDDALAALRESGALDALLAKWF